MSLQFHIRFDNQFNLVKDDKYDSKWKLKTELILINEEELKRRDRMSTIIPGINKQGIKVNDNIQESEVEKQIRNSEGEMNKISKTRVYQYLVIQIGLENRPSGKVYMLLE